MTTLDPREVPSFYYRVYLIGSDHKVQRATELFAKSDEDAQVQALQLVDGHAAELWLRGRIIARLNQSTTDARPPEVHRGHHHRDSGQPASDHPPV